MGIVFPAGAHLLLGGFYLLLFSLSFFLQKKKKKTERIFPEPESDRMIKRRLRYRKNCLEKKIVSTSESSV